MSRSPAVVAATALWRGGAPSETSELAVPDEAALCERLMTDIPQIRRINTQVVIDAIKVGLQVPV